LAITPILSRYQTEIILDARKESNRSLEVSLDLGLSLSEIQLDDRGAVFPDGQLILWGDLEEINQHEVGCFTVESGQIWKVQRFSELMNRVYSLMPTSGPPTMLVSGIPMHRIKDTNPRLDTLAKIKTLKPLSGQVLDTSTGLGYTAIEAAKTAEKVVTVEIDPAVLEICRINPWSARLFEDPRIESRTGDIFEEITQFEDRSFSRIIHDPPTISLAGQLYSAEFYERLARVLKPGGRLFHYIGDLKSRSGGRTSRGVVQRLKDAGFRRVVRKNAAFGVVAYP
jgi:predicted methyltransferase